MPCRCVMAQRGEACSCKQAAGDGRGCDLVRAAVEAVASAGGSRHMCAAFASAAVRTVLGSVHGACLVQPKEMKIVESALSAQRAAGMLLGQPFHNFGTATRALAGVLDHCDVQALGNLPVMLSSMAGNMVVAEATAQPGTARRRIQRLAVARGVLA